MTANLTVIHTDGACSGNPGPGGWAVLIDTPGQSRRTRHGGEAATTNNRMEMRAMITALQEAASIGGDVLIRSDSEYVIKGLTEWSKGWIAKGWKNAAGKPVVNKDLWIEMIAAHNALGDAKVDIKHVKGHAGDPDNEACDRLAVMARDEAGRSGFGI